MVMSLDVGTVHAVTVRRVVDGKDAPTVLHFPDELIQTIDGSKFLTLVRSNSSVRRLLACTCGHRTNSAAVFSVVPRCAVLQDIHRLQKAAVMEQATQGLFKAPDNWWSARRSKRLQTGLQGVAETVEIQLPGIDGVVDGITMRVDATMRRTAAVELTRDNIAWLAAVVRHQVLHTPVEANYGKASKSCILKRRRTAASASAASARAGDDAADEVAQAEAEDDAADEGAQAEAEDDAPMRAPRSPTDGQLEAWWPGLPATVRHDGGVGEGAQRVSDARESDDGEVSGEAAPRRKQPSVMDMLQAAPAGA